MGEETDFAVGDAVRLRVDGSPEMIIDRMEEDGRFLCIWNDGAGNPKSQAFPPRSLRRVEPARSSPPTHCS